MDRKPFRYIWRHSRRDQLIICAVVIASLPFYFASLDLPRRIVNEAIQGRAFERGQQHRPFPTFARAAGMARRLAGVQLFEGFEVDRLGLLFGLSGVFLFFVLINGAFKYWINVAKGALGERMLRRMRFELFALIMRFTPETLRTVKSSETATIIKDEVEPIGGFIGDAFVTAGLPRHPGAHRAGFIMVQNIWLGFIAVAVIGVQFTVIPRLRRELLRLGKQRQIASRRLAGRIGEVVDGIEAVHVHNAPPGSGPRSATASTSSSTSASASTAEVHRQVPQQPPRPADAVPVLRGRRLFRAHGQLDIGQLVAVIAAYRELPPPLKELIDWDQQRLDVQVKYDQVVQHFAARAAPPDRGQAARGEDMPLAGCSSSRT